MTCCMIWDKLILQTTVPLSEKQEKKIPISRNVYENWDKGCIITFPIIWRKKIAATEGDLRRFIYPHMVMIKWCRQWSRSGSPLGKPFLWYGFTLFAGNSKGPSGEETQAYPLLQINSSTGPFHFHSPNRSLYKTKQACRTVLHKMFVYGWL